MSPRSRHEPYATPFTTASRMLQNVVQLTEICGMETVTVPRTVSEHSRHGRGWPAMEGTRLDHQNERSETRTDEGVAVRHASRAASRFGPMLPSAIEPSAGVVDCALDDGSCHAGNSFSASAQMTSSPKYLPQGFPVAGQRGVEPCLGERFSVHLDIEEVERHRVGEHARRARGGVVPREEDDVRVVEAFHHNERLVQP